MAARTFYSTFNLHETGVNASLNSRAKAAVQQERDKVPIRGSAASGGKLFTGTDRDFGAEGITTDWRIQLISEVGNIDRDAAITTVATSVLTVDGDDFDTDIGGVQFVLYLPPTESEIVTDPTKRGTGTAGFDEFIDSVFSSLSETFPTALVDLQYKNGVLEQVMVVNDS